MVLQNYVVLQPGVPARMHFIAHEITTKTITDPLTNRPKAVKALSFTLDELNGQAAVGFYSTISDKHANDFAPWLPGEKYRGYDFIVTMTGEGFRREYQVQAIPRARA